MASIFSKDDNFVDKPKRNTFDLSFQNNLTLRFGRLIPAYVQEVLPGDSFKIDPTFGLRYLPQVFPVQTRMRAHLHFFYVRNRTIWKDWMDFIGKTKEGLVVPYLSPDRGEEYMLSESSIFDYMGLPLTIDSNDTSNNKLYSSVGDTYEYVEFTDSDIIPSDIRLGSNLGYYAVGNNPAFDYLKANEEYRIGYGSIYQLLKKPVNLAGSEIFVDYTGQEGDVTMIFRNIMTNKLIGYSLRGYSTSSNFTIGRAVTVEGESLSLDQFIGYVYSADFSQKAYLKVGVQPNINFGYPLNQIDSESLPFGTGVNGSLRISALPFRAYEAIYNSFYRNPENNPFLIGGTPEYNKYIVNDEGGACRLGEFQLFNRNWEDDAFTTAVPTPQQGDAPRVGLTADPNTPVYLNYSREDGSVGKLVLEADADGFVHAVSASNLTGTAEDDKENMSMVNMLNDVVQFGITISDLRNVNSFQRWLEKNVRKGYRYRDQLMSHYGVSVSYKDMMMPEFIGGVSRDVTVNQISQTVETETGNLGDMAGQAYVVGDGKSINHFCDEHGFIIGIVSVAPIPNYSQMIPKHFFKHDALDYYFPEFGKIGMQPITNKEIAAIASFIEGNADKTFGYQRAWYDYLARVDEVHGKFNSEFYNFLLQRKFNGVPQLGASFTTINNDDLNNIFYVDDGEDKILGQIYFDVSGIRPIPMYGIPSLE